MTDNTTTTQDQTSTVTDTTTTVNLTGDVNSQQPEPMLDPLDKDAQIILHLLKGKTYSQAMVIIDKLHCLLNDSTIS